MSEDALQTVHIRNSFYRDGYGKVMVALQLSFLVIVALVAAIFYVVTHPPEPKYFAVEADGSLIHIKPLDQPNLASSALLQWANQAAIAAYTYNFVNYKQELMAASEYFTPEGWHSFMTAIQESNNLKAVLEKKLVVSAVATGAPVIQQQGVLKGVYSWSVQMPMLVTYQSANEVSQQSLVVKMLITRVSTLNSVRGIGIAQFVVAEAGKII